MVGVEGCFKRLEVGKIDGKIAIKVTQSRRLGSREPQVRQVAAHVGLKDIDPVVDVELAIAIQIECCGGVQRRKHLSPNRAVNVCHVEVGRQIPKRGVQFQQG